MRATLQEERRALGEALAREIAAAREGVGPGSRRGLTVRRCCVLGVLALVLLPRGPVGRARLRLRARRALRAGGGGLGALPAGRA